MPEKCIPFVLYAVRLPDSDWRPEYIAAAPGNAAAIVLSKYPDVIGFRILAHGDCGKSVFNEKLDDMLGTWRQLNVDWYCDVLEEYRLAQDKKGIQPYASGLTATICINAEPQEHGWWHVRLEFTPSPTEGSAYWHQAYRSLETVQCEIHCSDVFDPIGDIENFLCKITDGKSAQVMIDEEGQFVHMLAWCPTQETIHLRIESLLYDEDYCHNFFLNKSLFLSEFKKVLDAFKTNGGWSWRDLDYEDDAE